MERSQGVLKVLSIESEERSSTGYDLQVPIGRQVSLNIAASLRESSERILAVAAA
jgi:hypothetical protein